MDMQTKLKQAERRLLELRAAHMEASRAGRTEEMNKYTVMLKHQMAAYQRGREFVMRVLEAKRVMAAQAQGSSQPAQESTPNPSTSQHQTPTMSATPQPAPNTNSHSTPRLATPHISANQNPNSMSAMNPNVNAQPSVGPGSTANPNAALLQPFNPAATQIPPQVGLGGVSVPDTHALGAMPQHGHSHNNSLGQMPPGFAAQMKKLVEQRGFTQNSQALNASGNNAATGAGAGMASGPGPATTGGFGETRDNQWLGTLVWQGTDTTRNEKKEVHAQVLATASSGNPYVHFHMEI